MKEATYKRYLLTVLLVILAFNYMDRLALGLLLQDIKVDLALSDTQLGFLTGIAFAMFYAVMGVPIARWADRGNRVTIITLTTALWSAALALSGTAANFVQLMLIRIGVAVGEAGCIPPAHSLIADHFTRAERPRAVARYMLGAPLSFVLGYFLAGWLNELYGWRWTFALLGLPGVAMAVLVRVTLREPRQKACAINAAGELTAGKTPSVKEVIVILWSSRTFRHVLLAYSVIYLFGSGIQQWQPAFFIRSYGLQTGELGTWFAAVNGGGGVLGMYLGGEWASRYAANNERLQLKVMAAVFASFGILASLIYLSPNQYIAFTVMGLTWMGVNATNGPLFATIQTLVPPRMRAMSLAIIYLFANLIGMGLGPLAAGALSDALRPLFGEESLRYALLVLCPGYAWGGWHVWRASLNVTRDLPALQEDDSSARERSGVCRHR